MCKTYALKTTYFAQRNQIRPKKSKKCHVHGLEDSVLLKMPTFSKLTYRLDAIPFKIVACFFVDS